jgi:hypothetical protein
MTMIIKQFVLNNTQLKAAIEQWLNACVLRQPCKVEEVEVYSGRVEVTVEDPKEVPQLPPSSSAYPNAPLALTDSHDNDPFADDIPL